MFQWNRTETKRMFFFCIDRISNWELKRPTKGLQNMLHTYIDMQNYILADIYADIFPTVFLHIFLPFPCLIRATFLPPKLSVGFELRSLVTTWLGLSMVMVGVTAVPGLLQILCIESATWRERREQILMTFFGWEKYFWRWMGWVGLCFLFCFL